MNDLLGGQINVIFPNITAANRGAPPHWRLRVLPSTAPARLDAAPDIPTATEEGCRISCRQIFFGVFAPIGTPNTIVEQINDVTQKEWADKEFRRS